MIVVNIMLYDYQCSKCDHVFERSLKITDRELPLFEACPNCERVGYVQKVILTPTEFGSSERLSAGNVKISDGFKDVLTAVKNGNRGSTIEI